MPAKRQSTARDLIAQLSQNLQAAPKPAPEEKPEALAPSSIASQEEKTPAKQSRAAGQTAAFWLDDEDRRIFHEISMHLYSQGIKPTNNLIFRAALRLLEDGQPFLEKVRELMAADGRVLRHKIKKLQK